MAYVLQLMVRSEEGEGDERKHCIKPTMCHSWGAEYELPVWRDGKIVNSVNILGMWNCRQEEHLLFQAYSKLVFRFLAEISPVGR